MTPITKVRPLPASPLAGQKPPKAPQPIPLEPLKISSNAPLIQLLQASGRTPTHPLTAGGKTIDPRTQDVNPVDAQKAAKFFREAEVHAQKGKLKPAFEALQKAYLLNPHNEQIAAALSEILFVGGQAPLALEVLGEFLTRHPKSLLALSSRASLSDNAVEQIRAVIHQASDKEREQLGATAEQLSLASLTDQAQIYYLSGSKVREQLDGLRKEFPTLRGQSQEVKRRVLGTLQNQAQRLSLLAKLPTLPAAEREAMAKELNGLSQASWKALIEFVETDSDASLKAELPLLKAERAMAEGKDLEAVVFFEEYRETECKKLGDGDFGKGLALLKEKFAKAKEAETKQDLEGFQKAVAGLPEALLTAHAFLDRMETVQLRTANFAALAAWREDISRRARAKDAEVSGPSVFWDAFWGDRTEHDEIQTEEFKELNLASAVYARLLTGKFNTLSEALNDLRKNGDADEKERATEVLATTGVLGFGPIGTTGTLIHYGASNRPDTEEGAELLKKADDLASGSAEQQRAAAGLYKMVGALTRDSAQREEALKAYEKLPEEIRNPK